MRTLGHQSGEAYKWFAWRPVWTDLGPRWLCYVIRRPMYMPSWDEGRDYSEYDAIRKQ